MKTCTKIIFVGILIQTNLFAQVSEAFIKDFIHLKLGYGMTYIGNGVNLEYGHNRFSAYLASGYMKALETDNPDVTIPKGINFGGGFRYYINKYTKDTDFRLGFGARYGWIDKYYDPQIGLTQYNHNIKGICLEAMFQICPKQRFIIDIGMSIAPSFMVFKSGNQPYLSNLYWFPHIGVGYNFMKIRQNRIETHGNIYRAAVESEIRTRKFRRTGPQPYQDACCNTVVYQEIDSMQYIVVRFDQNALNITSEFQNYTVGTHANKVEVFIAEYKNLNWDLCCSICFDSISSQNSEHWVAQSGLAAIATDCMNKRRPKPYKISVILSGLRFTRTDDSGVEAVMFLDDMYIFDVLNKRFCNGKHNNNIE